MYDAYKIMHDNEIKLLFFIFLTTAIILFLGYIISEIFGFGINGLFISFIVAAAANFFSYFFSKNIVLMSQHAIPMKYQDFPEYCDMVKGLCERNNIIMPELYYIQSSSLNAFATGRNQKNAAVVVTSGLLEKLPLEEISGVIGHELSHILHKDIMITSFITTLVGLITIMGSIIRNGSLYRTGSARNQENSILMVFGLIAALAAPIVAILIKMAVSRSREYMADADGALICGNPQLLANALYRISQDDEPMPVANTATAHLYIANPMKRNPFANLFSTHPDINDRIRRLREMQ